MELILGADAAAPAAARAAMGAFREALGPRFDDLLLIVSELVSNGVVHGPSTAAIVVSAVVDEDRIRLAVTDGGDCFDPHDRSHGRGLQIVDRLAAAWGVSTTASCRVWVDLAADGLE